VSRTAPILLALAAVTGAAFQPAAAQTNRPEERSAITQRFALVIGANNGGPRREKLRYAISDARAMLQVLETLGGVSPDDSRLLVEPSRETFLWEIARLRERLLRQKSANHRREAIIYYSGHSDDSAILLGQERISYREFRDMLENLDADVRIAILDSCASGALLRPKGGKRRAPFLVDSAFDMKGVALLTSSSSDEVSQESDRIRGSFFTHHLLSGLRGAADASHDGRVTLNEVYQYAFGATLQQTEKTSGGPQHPSFDIQMAGTGDVVITEIRQSEAVLRLGRAVAGKVFIHGQANALIAEFQKQPGTSVELGVSKGRYRVIVIGDSEIREASLDLAPGQTRELDVSLFSSTEIIDAIARGDQKAGREGWEREKRTLPFFVGFYGKVSRFEGRWSFMPGMQFGVAIIRSLFLGLTGFGKTAPGENRRPPFWGFNVDYLLLEQKALGVRLRTIVGFMYKNAEERLARHLSTVVEPGVGLALSLNRNLKVVTYVSLDFVSGTNDNLRRYSWGLGLEYAKP
jgi:hypothetical protein